MHHQQDSNRGYVLATGTIQKLFKDKHVEKTSENHTLILPLYCLHKTHIFQRTMVLYKQCYMCVIIMFM